MEKSSLEFEIANAGNATNGVALRVMQLAENLDHPELNSLASMLIVIADKMENLSEDAASHQNAIMALNEKVVSLEKMLDIVT